MATYKVIKVEECTNHRNSTVTFKCPSCDGNGYSKTEVPFIEALKDALENSSYADELDLAYLIKRYLPY